MQIPWALLNQFQLVLLEGEISITYNFWGNFIDPKKMRDDLPQDPNLKRALQYKRDEPDPDYKFSSSRFLSRSIYRDSERLNIQAICLKNSNSNHLGFLHHRKRI